jgi:hypothetical protein
MLKAEQLNKLYALATGKQTKENQIKEIEKQDNSRVVSKAKNELAKYKGLFMDPYEAWTKWYSKTKATINSKTADDIWSVAEQEFPGSPDQAKDWLRQSTNGVINKQDKTAKEIALRNEMSSSPSWLVNEMVPELQNTSAIVSNQNLGKAKAVYKKMLEQRLDMLDLTQLDPEVPAETHIEDAIKLEILGLMEGASIVNGRFVTMNPQGQIQPAFSISGDMGIGGPEMETIQEVATPILHDRISTALNIATSQVEMDNKASGGAYLDMLKNGNLEVNEWQNAISMLGDTNGVVDAGISGMVNKNPFMSDSDILSSAVDIGTLLRGNR